MKRILIILLGILAIGGAMAGGQPFQLSLTPQLSLVDRTNKVDGVSLNIWGENRQSGLALGIVNGSTGFSSGLSVALILNYADFYNGIQVAPVNLARADFWGLQIGIVNCTDGRMKGLQFGMLNIAGHLAGFQVGLVNYAGSAKKALQLGLVNVNPRNDWFTELPEELAPEMFFLNWRF